MQVEAPMYFSKAIHNPCSVKNTHMAITRCMCIILIMIVDNYPLGNTI